MKYHFETVNGETVKLGQNEHKADWKCPVCGGDIITNYGPGIEISWCEKCGYDYTDYS